MWKTKVESLSTILCFSLFLTGLLGCSDKKQNNSAMSTSTSPSQNPSGTNTSQDSPCAIGSPPGIADAGQTLEYYKLNSPKLSAHGTANPNRFASSHPNGVVWSSKVDLAPSITQDILRTDSRFHIRVRPLKGLQYENDSKGIYCQYIANDYTKLQIGVLLRKEGNVGGDYYLFDNLEVGKFSGVHPFVVPPNSSEPLIIEVKDIKWDYTCADYAKRGFPNVPGVCPYAPVWDTSCVAFEVQFATDGTKDFPCPKIY